MKNRFLIITTILLVFISFSIFSQPAGGGPPGNPGGPPCWPPPCIPIDGGIGFLIAIATAIGIKKIYFSKTTKP